MTVVSAANKDLLKARFPFPFLLLPSFTSLSRRVSQLSVSLFMSLYVFGFLVYFSLCIVSMAPRSCCSARGVSKGTIATESARLATGACTRRRAKRCSCRPVLGVEVTRVRRARTRTRALSLLRLVESCRVDCLRFRAFGTSPVPSSAKTGERSRRLLSPEWNL